MKAAGKSPTSSLEDQWKGEERSDAQRNNVSGLIFLKRKRKKNTARPSALLLTHFYPPEPCAAANRAFALASAIEAAGMEVQIVTAFPSFPDGILSPADRVISRKLKSSKTSQLIRLFTFASPRLSARNRLLNWLSVSLSMTAYVIAVGKRFDFVIVTTPPITLAVPALVARLHCRNLVVDVRDVFPDVAIKMGYWKESSAIVKSVAFLATMLYRYAHLVICVTESAREEVIARGSIASKTIVAANGFDGGELAAMSPYTRRPIEFVAAFVGNMGLATALDVVLDAAKELKACDNVKFVLAGGGADKDRLAARIAGEGLENVVMLGVISRPQANALIADADVAIVPLHHAILDSVPTKIYDALALGCPVICCANGEARSLVERSGGGIVVKPNDSVALAEAVKQLACDPKRRAGFAVKGKAFIAQRFDRALIMRGVVARLQAML